MRQPKAKSKYAIKKNEQRNGNYRPTSPFYLPPSMRDKGVMRELTTERGTPVIVNPAHVVTIEPAQDDKGHTILGIIVVLLDLFRSAGTVRHDPSPRHAEEVGDASGSARSRLRQRHLR